MSAGKRDVPVILPGTLVAWALPVAAMVGVIGVPQPVKTCVRVAGLVWMGIACLWKARQCSRRHCYWTGPFFLLMTLPVLGYGFLPLGTGGWIWHGAAIGIGTFGLTAWTERGGKYA